MPALRRLRLAFERIPGNLRGMILMALAGLIFASFMAIVRHVGSTVPAPQAAFLRYAIGLVFLLPFFLRVRVADLRHANLKLHAIRGLIHGLGVICWFFAMTRIPIAEVTALGFTAPVFATIGAVLFLGERVRIRRILAVAAGLLGAVIILRPGFAVIDYGALAMLIAAPVFAVSELMAKVLTRRESSAAVVAYLSIFVTLIALGPALYVWKAPTQEELVMLAITAGLATLGHIVMVEAFRAAELSAIQSIKFLQLIWAALVGYLAFAEAPALATWIGAAVIVASTSYIAHREAVARRRGEQSLNPSATRIGKE